VHTASRCATASELKHIDSAEAFLRDLPVEKTRSARPGTQAPDAAARAGRRRGTGIVGD
jgi:hypothetical protein